jgi:DNA end-binding protein Ku
VPTAIWTGSLSFGLVVIPVRLHPAIRKKMVRFHELDSRGRRVRRVRVADDDLDAMTAEPALWTTERTPAPKPLDGRDASSRPPERTPDAPPVAAPSHVEWDEIRKGFEVAPGQYVSLSRDEVRELAPERSRSIEVERFVYVTAVDPIYFESRYHLTPQRDSARAFQLLKGAMAEAGRMAIATFTMRRREYVSAIRPFAGAMLLTTMVRADEILAVEWAPDVEVEPSDRELKMARLLVDSMTGRFEPDLYTDEHRERLLRLIAAKTPGAQTADVSPAPSPTRVLDLMAALEASVKAARAARRLDESDTKPAAPRRRAGGNRR